MNKIFFWSCLFLGHYTTGDVNFGPLRYNLWSVVHLICYRKCCLTFAMVMFHYEDIFMAREMSCCKYSVGCRTP